jgi:hypothetical protein
MPTLLRDSLDPRCAVIDRNLLGGSARVFNWDQNSWGPFPKQTRVLIPMRPMPRTSVKTVAEQIAARFKGGQVIVYETDDPSWYTMGDVFASYKRMKKGLQPTQVQPSPLVYVGLAYTRIAGWCKILKPLTP